MYNKPFFLLTLLALGYLARLLFRLSISTWGNVEDNVIESPQSKTNHQDTTACSEQVQESDFNFQDRVKAYSLIYEKYIVEVVAHTNRFGVVSEEDFSMDVQNFICQEAVWRNAYMDYRIKAWNRCQKDRLDPAFDAYGYNPNNSRLLHSGPRDVGGTDKDANPQENGATPSPSD